MCTPLVLWIFGLFLLDILLRDFFYCNCRCLRAPNDSSLWLFTSCDHRCLFQNDTDEEQHDEGYIFISIRFHNFM